MALHEIKNKSISDKWGYEKQASKLSQYPQYDLYVPEHASSAFSHNIALRSQPANPALPTNFFQQSNHGKVLIESNSAGKPTFTALRFRLSVSSAAVAFLPIYYWLDRIEVWTNGGSKFVQRLYADQLYFNSCVIYTDEQRKSLAPLANLDAKTWGPSYRFQQSGTSQDYYLHLPNLWLDMCNPELSIVSQKIELRLFPNNSLNIKVDAGAGTYTLDAVEMLFVEEQAMPDDAQMIRNFYLQNAIGKPFNESVLIESTQTLTAGQQAQVDLRTLQGNFSEFLICILEGSASVSDYGVMNFVSLGDTALYDIVDPSGNSFISNNSAIQQKVLQEVLPIHLQTNSAQRAEFISIPFGNTMNTLSGHIDGFLSFNGKSNFLRIVPRAGTQQVWTLTNNGGNPSGGYYRIAFVGDDGSYSQTEPLAHNANAAAIKAAVELMPAVRQHRFLVTANQALSAGNVTLTANIRKYIPGNFQVINESLATTTHVTSAITTFGIEGINSGVSHTIRIYALRHQFSYQIGGDNFLVSQ